MKNDEQEFKHESYCLVSLSRQQGNPKLFGTAIDRHYNYVKLQVKHATLIRDANGDRYFARMHGDIVSVDLSAAQFAELLTTMNVGCGVPGTLHSFNNVRVEEPPDIDKEDENISKSFEKNLRVFVSEFSSDTIPQAKKILAKQTLNKADRYELVRMFEKVEMELKSNIPFLIDCFSEAIQKRVSSAKAEVDSLFTSVVHKLGLKSLSDLPKQLQDK